MQGYQLTFFTLQDRHHGGFPLGEWLLQEARRLGLSGATLITAAQGFGHNGKMHSAHFFELADQPVMVMMALSTADIERLFQRLRDEEVDVFYVKAPIEFGMTGQS